MTFPRLTAFLVKFAWYMLGVAACLTIIGIPIGIKIFREVRKPIVIHPKGRDASWDPVPENLAASWDDFTMNRDDDAWE